MYRPRPLPRRVLAAVAAALVGLGGAALPTPPAGAQSTAAPAEVSGSCAWDQEAGQWLVAWTIEPTAPDGASSYRLAEVASTPPDSPVEGIEQTGAAGTFPHPAGEELVGAQWLPEGTATASLTVRTEWDTGQLDEPAGSGTVEVPGDCQVPDLLDQWTVGCQALTITIGAPSGQDATVTLAPSTGEPVDVEVAGGGSATVEFPPAEGLTVDVLYHGRSVVDPADPIAVSPDDLAGLECDEEPADGAGGGLPATGTPTILVAAGALALSLLGTGLYLVARRRRIRFTA